MKAKRQDISQNKWQDKWQNKWQDKWQNKWQDKITKRERGLGGGGGVFADALDPNGFEGVSTINITVFNDTISVQLILNCTKESSSNSTGISKKILKTIRHFVKIVFVVENCAGLAANFNGIFWLTFQ